MFLICQGAATLSILGFPPASALGAQFPSGWTVKEATPFELLCLLKKTKRSVLTRESRPSS